MRFELFLQVSASCKRTVPKDQEANRRGHSHSCPGCLPGFRVSKDSVILRSATRLNEPEFVGCSPQRSQSKMNVMARKRSSIVDLRFETPRNRELASISTPPGEIVLLPRSSPAGRQGAPVALRGGQPLIYCRCLVVRFCDGSDLGRPSAEVLNTHIGTKPSQGDRSTLSVIGDA